MTYNAANRRDVRQAEKADKLADQQRGEMISGIMSLIPGRAWMCDQLEACHIFSDPFSGDALREAYAKGERNVGLRLLADIMRYCPDQYILMMNERNARDAARDNASSQRGRSPDANGGDQGPGGDLSDYADYIDGREERDAPH